MLRNSSAVVAAQHDEGMVFLDTLNGILFASNRVGADIWFSLQAARTAPEIAREIASAYSIPLDTAHAHVEAFVAALGNHGLLEPSRSC